MLGVIAQAPDGIRHVEIARKLHVKAPLITTMARSLQQRDLIQSVQNQFDARAKLLALTPAGKKLLKIVESDIDTELSMLLSGLNETEMTTYHKVLQTIINNDKKSKLPGLSAKLLG